MMTVGIPLPYLTVLYDACTILIVWNTPSICHLKVFLETPNIKTSDFSLEFLKMLLWINNIFFSMPDYKLFGTGSSCLHSCKLGVGYNPGNTQELIKYLLKKEMNMQVSKWRSMQHSVKISVGVGSGTSYLQSQIPVLRNPNTQEEYHELWASVGYTVTFRPAWVQYDTLPQHPHPQQQINVGWQVIIKSWELMLLVGRIIINGVIDENCQLTFSLHLHCRHCSTWFSII